MTTTTTTDTATFRGALNVAADGRSLVTITALRAAYTGPCNLDKLIGEAVKAGWVSGLEHDHPASAPAGSLWQGCNALALR